ncbi:DNA topoisomerase IB [Phytomonospora endophytica]|uniref:DNA topoisomerase IB n=1 Tax=Phytomonospora endophytica TaxID=714109 RepID=UPI0016204341|nr:DNA topoisomerase IB [Phytomonospora endophytica]GIG67947.1 DNA topoisomerase [Phytomonospora endophytica]
MRRVDPRSPGIRRRRRGRGFSYVGADGAAVGDADLARIDALVIPPAWRRVWICADPAGHIQAVGYDAAGRRQYLYHEDWRRDRDEEKHQRVRDLSERLPAFRAAVTRDLRGRGATRRRILAAALRIVDLGVFRSGGEEYTEDNGSYGLATLLRGHVRMLGDRLTFRYPAKSGVEREVVVDDARLGDVVRAMRRSPGERFLAYRDDEGWHDVRAADVNERFKDLVGDEYTVKDLRTWHATVTAARAFADTDATEASVMRAVADELGNTPAVARDAYVDPRVIEAFEEGRTVSRRAGDAEVRALLDGPRLSPSRPREAWGRVARIPGQVAQLVRALA